MKIDLHIHTIKNELLDDQTFEPDVFKIKKYVEVCSLEAIAITNHNIFDKEQFLEIQKVLAGMCLVLPGVEVSLSAGHILVIGSPSEETYEALKRIVEQVEADHPNKNYGMSFEKFNSLVTGKGFLLIPHYRKSKQLTLDQIKQIKEQVYVGEVGSSKQFCDLKKNKDELVPVRFSDIRISKDLTETKMMNSEGYTYLECGSNPDFYAIAKALKDREHVTVAKEDAPDLFDLNIGDLKTTASTKVNVLLGKRSSGKTHTLNALAGIEKPEEEVKKKGVLYIKQFEISKGSSDTEFGKSLAKTSNEFGTQYCKELLEIMDFIDDLKIKNTEQACDEYLSSLKKYAENAKKDTFSRSPLFNYDPFELPDTHNRAKTLLTAAEKILKADKPFSDVLEMHIKRRSLLDYVNALLKLDKRAIVYEKAINLANEVMKTISDALGEKTQTVQIKPMKFTKLFRIRKARKEFDSLIQNWKEHDVDIRNVEPAFKQVISTERVRNLGTLKSSSWLGATSRSIEADRLINDPPTDGYLWASTTTDFTNATGENRWKIFVQFKTRILNQYGKKISGGQTAEYQLFRKLSDYKGYDTILIDEMESSFDNPFLNGDIVRYIHQISECATVFISTHNNNLGVSLQPNRYIYHTVDLIDGKTVFNIYSGSAQDKDLKTDNGKAIPLRKVLLDTMEAGEKAYYQVEFVEDGVDIFVPNGPHLRFNKNKDQMRFRFFKASTYKNQEPVQLYRLDYTADVAVSAKAFADKFVAAPICGTDDNTPAIATEFNKFIDEYSTKLSRDVRAYLANRDGKGDASFDAFYAKYDAIMDKRASNTEFYDFLAGKYRPAKTQGVFGINQNVTDSTTWSLVGVGAVTIAASASLLFFRRKKSN